MSFDHEPRPDGTGRPPRWEYKDVLIYLNLSTSDFPDRRLLERRFEGILDRRLRQAAADGWEPDGPTGWDALRAAGRISRRQTSPFSARGIFQPAYVYEYATVRLRRPLAR